MLFLENIFNNIKRTGYIQKGIYNLKRLGQIIDPMDSSLQDVDEPQHLIPQHSSPAIQENVSPQDYLQDIPDTDVQLAYFRDQASVERKYNRLKEKLLLKGCPRGMVEEIANEIMTTSLSDAGKYLNFFKKNPSYLPPNAKVLQEPQKNSLLKGVLINLINKEDPIIEEWLSTKGNWRNSTELSIDTPIGGEGDGERGDELTEQNTQNRIMQRREDYEKSVEYIEKQKGAAEKEVAAFVKFYINDIQRQMGEILIPAMDKTVDDFFEKKGFDKLTGKIKPIPIETGRGFNQYLSVERFSIYAKELLKQSTILFDDSNASIIPQKGDFRYANNKGQIIIPQGFLEKVFGFRQKGETAQVLAEKIKKYQLSHKDDIDISTWFKGNMGSKGILTNRALQEGYIEMSFLKNFIVSLYNQGYRKEDAILEVIKKKSVKNKDRQVIGLGDLLLKYSLGSKMSGGKVSSDDIMKRFISLTIKQMEEPKGQAYINFLKQVAQGKGGEPVYHSLRANAQWDVTYLMPALNNIKLNGGNKYSNDVFKAIIGSINPHAKVKDLLNPAEYKNLMENEQSGSVENIKDKIPDSAVKKYQQIMNNYISTKRVYEHKLAIYNEIKTEKDNKIKEYNQRVLNKLEQENNKRRATGSPLISTEDFVNVMGWEGTQELSYKKYYSLGIKMAPTALSLLDQKMNEVKRGKMTLKKRQQKGFRPDNRHLGLDTVKGRWNKIQQDLKDFKQEYGITDIQERLARILYINTQYKLSAISLMKQKTIKLAGSDSTIWDDKMFEVQATFEHNFSLLIN